MVERQEKLVEVTGTGQTWTPEMKSRAYSEA